MAALFSPCWFYPLELVVFMNDLGSRPAMLPPTRGISRLPFLLLLAFSAAVFYVMVVWLPDYLSFQQMRSATEEIVDRGALQSLDLVDVKAQIQQRAREHGLPTDYDLQVVRQGRRLQVRLTYSKPLYLPLFIFSSETGWRRASVHWPYSIYVDHPGI